MSWKTTWKKAVFRPFSALGAFGLTRRLLGGDVLILCYHRIVDEPLEHFQPGMVVSKDLFRRHIEWLSRRFEIMDLADFAARFLAGEKPVRPVAVITFDDGWLDNFEVAFPILKDMGVTATIFLPTGFIGTKGAYWNARAEKAVRKIHERRDLLVRAFPDEKMPEGAAFLVDLLLKNPPVSVKIDRVIESVKILPPSQILEVTEFLEFLARIDGKPERTILDWDEVRQMKEAGIRFGSHSVNHRIMTQLSASECFAEASQSLRVMTERLGEQPLCFAYPNGNYNETVVREVRRAGYLCAVAIYHGFASRGADLFSIPRFCIHEGGAPSEAVLDFLLSGIPAR